MLAPPTIRSATDADVDPLLGLIHAAYRGESSRGGWTTEADLLDGNRTDAELLAADLADPDTELLVADDAGTVVACCAVTRLDDLTASFGTFAVRPERQGDGLGRRLLGEAEALAARRGATTMEMSVISVRDELIAWYVRRGYVATERTKPFPYGDARYGVPRRDDLVFRVLSKPLTVPG